MSFMSMADTVQDIVRWAYRRQKIQESEANPHIHPRETLVRKYFAEYPYVIEWSPMTTTVSDAIARSEQATAWCRENCIGGFHSDILRVVKTSSYSDREEWALNDVGGKDIWFWAFDVEQDAVLFSLKWSS